MTRGLLCAGGEIAIIVRTTVQNSGGGAGAPIERRGEDTDSIL